MALQIDAQAFQKAVQRIPFAEFIEHLQLQGFGAEVEEGLPKASGGKQLQRLVQLPRSCAAWRRCSLLELEQEAGMILNEVFHPFKPVEL